MSLRIYMLRIVSAVLLCLLALPAILRAQISAQVSLTLPEAVRRAEQNEPTLATVRAEARVAAMDRNLARTALLPGAVYHNQALYTQPNGSNNAAGPAGSQSSPSFIANNAVREYASLVTINEIVGVTQVANIRLADANAARTAAEAEVARRGLAVATAGLFFGVLAGDRRIAVLHTARDEAQSFVILTEEREAAREVAHADVLKAQLTLEQRERDVVEAALSRDHARLELGALVFADPFTPFTVEEPSPASISASVASFETAARNNNPELASALASLRQSDAEVLAAQAAYLPDLALNFSYGIDATSFATKGPLDRNLGRNPRNLGYSFGATLDIPVWDWLSTERRVKQSEYRRDAVRVALTATQRRLVVNFREAYTEEQTAQAQLASLETSAHTAEQSLRLSRLRYESGEAAVLEVVDAQTTLLNARIAQEDGQVRFQQALSGLQILTGSL